MSYKRVTCEKIFFDLKKIGIEGNTMTTNKEMRNQLLDIHTNFHKDENKPTFANEIKMDSFASFLTYKQFLPNKEQIESDFKEELEKDEDSNFLPNNLFEKYHYDFNFDENFFADKSIGGEGDNEFNDNAMFVAMNVAARPEGFSIEGWKNFHDQKDMSRDSNILKLNLEVNDPMFRGCYLTDAIKRVTDSNSSNVKNDFFADNSLAEWSFTNDSDDMNDDLRAKKYMELDEREAKNYEKKHPGKKYERRFESKKDALRSVKQNRIIFYKSANVFVEEWKTIKPERIISLGGTSKKLLERMVKTEVFQQYPGLCKMVEESIQITHYSYRLNFKDFYNRYADSLIDQIK